MTTIYNWWMDRWECESIKDAKKIARDAKSDVYYKEQNIWKLFNKQ